MNAAKYQQQHGDNCSEIFWGLHWEPHFDGDYQTNQISRVQAGNSIPFTRSKIQLRSPKPLDARPIAPEAGIVMHVVLRIVRLAA
jgi:hypothetical protein